MVGIWSSEELLQPGSRTLSSLKKQNRSQMYDLGGGSQVSHFRFTGFPSMGWEGLALNTGCGNSSIEKHKNSSQGSETPSSWRGIPVFSAQCQKVGTHGDGTTSHLLPMDAQKRPLMKVPL